jgi:vitamin B12 transporter
MLRPIACCFLLAMLPVRRLVWSAETPPAYRATVVVTADRLEEPIEEVTDSITVITRQQIEQRQAADVADLLRQVPGLDVVRSGTPGKVTSVFLRGAESDQVLIQIDGVTVNDPVFGGFDLGQLSTDNIERIEILRGPQSPLYGSDAVAGVIQILTRKGSGPARLEGSLEGGGYGTFRGGGSVSGALGPAYYSLAGSRFSTDGLTTISPFESSFATGNDGFEQTVFSGRAGYQGAGRETDVSLRYNEGSFGVPVSGELPAPLRGGTSETLTLSARHRQRLAPGWHASARISYADREDRTHDPEDVFGFTFFDVFSDTWTVSLQSDAELAGGQLLSVGYEVEHAGGEEQDSFGAIEGSLTTHAVFAQDKLDLGRLLLTAGLRYDHSDQFGSHANPRVSAAYDLGRGARLRGSLGSAFRAPLLGELLPPFFGNPELEPEESIGFDLGYEQQLGRGEARFGLTYFNHDFDHLIVFDGGTFRFENVASARTRGVELFGTARLDRSTHLNANYTYLDARNLGADERLLRRPTHRGNLYLHRSLGRRLSAGLGAHLVGQRLDDDFRADHPGRELNPGYVKVDLLLEYLWSPQLSLFGRIENLFDQDYQEALGFDTLGLTAFGGLRIAVQ